jgi:hypothetical protein
MAIFFFFFLMNDENFYYAGLDPASRVVWARYIQPGQVTG